MIGVQKSHQVKRTIIGQGTNMSCFHLIFNSAVGGVNQISLKGKAAYVVSLFVIYHYCWMMPSMECININFRVTFGLTLEFLRGWKFSMIIWITCNIQMMTILRIVYSIQSYFRCCLFFAILSLNADIYKKCSKYNIYNAVILLL